MLHVDVSNPELWESMTCEIEHIINKKESKRTLKQIQSYAPYYAGYLSIALCNLNQFC